jgi:hypothetical protein
VRRQTVTTTADLDRLEAIIVASAEAAVRDLKQLLDSRTALDALAVLKFSEAGKDPLDPDRSLNIVEQLNQSFTYLASTAAARWLLEHHPDCVPLVLNLGTAPGSDIESRCGRFAAETFAATHPKSNDKLRKDIEKVRTSSAQHRFVFFLSPVAADEAFEPGVTVVHLDHRTMGILHSTKRCLATASSR